ncbi:MAG: hypothetical protein SCK70_16255, partial [bacterium]|nr:hypothetical protein [bacterium]
VKLQCRLLNKRIASEFDINGKKNMNKKPIKFYLNLVVGSCIILFLLLVVISFALKTELSKEIGYGYLTSLIIFSLGFISINWSFNKNIKIFMAVVIGGIMVRFLFIGLLIFFVMRYTDLQVVYLISTFVVFYLSFQFFEFRFINSLIQKGNK